MIAAVGHADLCPDTLELVESEVRARVERWAGSATAVVRAGAGLPVAFGRAVHAAGGRLVVLLAAEGTVPAPLPQRDRAAAGELLLLADRANLVEFDPDDRAACIGADEWMIRTSRRLLAVWDGSPSDGRDATAHLVAYARARGVPVDVVWPEGAARDRGSLRHLRTVGRCLL
ncbi:hypothetical protein HYE82_20900 [Streptomyces sp. BR123]|uniref:hypothetical protein n=1 Tax=Streptomyces sp. BR123 TaxID=2749828 RepID=UPI0015C4B925|nr:hypothetical protein [Streptomyces sp. BR123]NXY96798.1 hypothetical protein [Streptomyces sp. BR123]